MRLFAKVSYKGTNYSGWQKQPNCKTIQEEIETQLSKYFNRPITIYGSGRTDAGVHAYGQTFHFDIDVNEIDLDRLLYSINQMLPDDIKILDIDEVDENTHARFSAKGKIYSYTMLLMSKDPFLKDMVYLYPKKIDVNRLKEVLSHFEGKHNFKNFTSKEEDEDNFVREIYSIQVEDHEDLINITLYGSGFMRYMIRFIIGEALFVSEDESIDMSYIDDLLDENSERHVVTHKAPACGLNLINVIY